MLPWQLMFGLSLPKDRPDKNPNITQGLFVNVDGRKASPNVRKAVASNGRSNSTTQSGDLDVATLLIALRKMRDGDFSVRLPSSWTGLDGKVADTFNEIVS